MYCHNTALLDKHLAEYDQIAEQDRILDALSRELAEQLLHMPVESDGHQSIYAFIYNNLQFTLQYEKAVQGVVTTPSIENIESLQKFMFEMAYEVARIEIEQNNNEYEPL